LVCSGLPAWHTPITPSAGTNTINEKNDQPKKVVANQVVRVFGPKLQFFQFCLNFQ
jgi:hypothetical protein